MFDEQEESFKELYSEFEMKIEEEIYELDMLGVDELWDFELI